MGFVKVVKNKAYYMRYQVKFRRRRQGKTDYQQRKGLVFQDKNKYNAKKYRLVARISNKYVTCQIVYSTITGDRVIEAAHSKELTAFGAKAGLSNYAACYATGLLCARRVLKKLKLDSHYTGNDEINGEYYEVEEVDDGPRPFRCYLDVGLARTSTGARIFGCLKGAVDGGLAIPHGENRFPGYDASEKELDAEMHASYIFGAHVGEYMEYMEEEDKSQYDLLFSQYIKNGIGADDVKPMWEKTHAAIRANPDRAKSDGKKHNTVVKGRKKRLSRQQRQNKTVQKIASFEHKMAQSDE
jgi:large subunit ribosomal protein L5e